MLDEHAAFLNARTDAADSDIEALERRFGLTEREAGEIYCSWLDTAPPTTAA